MEASAPRPPRQGPRWLVAGLQAGVERYGDCGIDLPTYRDHVLAAAARHLAASSPAPIEPRAVSRAARRLQLADLYLACACERQQDPAWSALRGLLGYRLVALLRRRGVPMQTASEIADDLPGLLLVTRSARSGSTALAGYDGTGSLFGWLAVVAMREWHRRRLRARPDPGQGTPAEPAVALPPDDSTVACFRDAMQRTWSRLPPRHRTVLELRYGQGVSQVDIARLLGVGPPRVSRMLDRAIQVLRASVAATFASRDAIAPTDWAALRDTLDSELRRLHGRVP